VDPTVTVYQFEEYDHETRRWRLSGRRATLDAITQAGGIAIRSTGLVVDASRIDADGFVISPRSMPEPEEGES
jgi:hypothetical protein